MRDIKELDLEQLKETLKVWGQPSFRARQIFSWIYQKGVRDFGRMSDLAVDLRKKLEEEFSILDFTVSRRLRSEDGTEKFLFELADKNLIEAVGIPTEDRITGCISTQAGCRFSCRFCASGKSGFQRNLTCGEMLGEAWYLKYGSAAGRLTHIVFMGTGEPLDNYDNLLKAIRIMNSPYSFNIGARRITISTCGIIPGIKRLAEEGLQVELSVSLHAADDKTRTGLMPVSRIYPLGELIKACRDYARKTNRQVTFEYVLIKDLNSDLQSAQKLSTILAGFNNKVNLIPANPVRGMGIEPPNKLEILLFKDRLLKSGVNVTLRKPRGKDIDAACGQLRLNSQP